MKEKNGEHPFGDVGQLISLAVFMVLWVADSFFLKISTFLSSYVPLYVRISILLAAIAIAVSLVKSGHVVVGHEQRSRSLVSSGAFRYIRHPLYLGSVLFYFGMAVSTASLFSIALLVVIFIFYNYIAQYEEKLLEKEFGEEYELYKHRTGKWVPKIW